MTLPVIKRVIESWRNKIIMHHDEIRVSQLEQNLIPTVDKNVRQIDKMNKYQNLDTT